MARAFTQYWKNTTLDWHESDELDHSASNQFKARGVRPGDSIFIVTVIDGNMHLGGVLIVDKLVGKRAAQKKYGKNVWDARDHVFGHQGRPFYKDLVVPMSTVRALQFEGNKGLVFKTPGQLDTQTLRGVRELTNESAEVLIELLDTRAAGKTARNLPRETALTDLGRLFGDELTMELSILQRPDLSETEKQAIIMARRGQGIFRDNLLRVEPRCRVTGTVDSDYLVASHIKPWSDSSNSERLSENNGLMLAPHVDHLFDHGYISFSDVGDLLVSRKCAVGVLERWGIASELNVGPFRTTQRPFLAYHREHCFKI